jgi:hypothetical protein
MQPVMLISAPWALYNRPSIQIGALKAYLSHQFPSLPVQAEHFHFQTATRLGYPLYQAVSQRTWIAECIAAALLFPDRFTRINRVFQRESRRDKLVRETGLSRLTAQLDTACTVFCANHEWERFGLIGFSISLCQLSCSLLLIRRIKQLRPELPVVVGGSTFSGESGEVLTSLFPEIDYLIHGEGEQPLATCVEAVCGAQTMRHQSPRGQVHNLDSLPTPDFAEYFELMQTIAPEKRFFATLPVEASRGCWWQASPVSNHGLDSGHAHPPQEESQQAGQTGQTVPSGQRHGCCFCNLNLQWRGYRAKSPSKITQEIQELSNRHKLLNFAFMDNILPRKGARELFASLADAPQNFRFFAEIRADTPRSMLESMRRAGVRELQVGVEALSTGLLSRMNKGTSALDNLEMMRHCEALGLDHGGNLMLHFPGSTSGDVQETLHVMEFAALFRPLRQVGFWLGLESPVYSNPERFGIRLLGNDSRWNSLFPAEMTRRMRFMIQGFAGNRSQQRQLWQPVAARLRTWAKDYHRLMRGPNPAPVLGYQDGGDFLLLTRRVSPGVATTHRLPRLSRDLYLYCRTARCREEIQGRFPALAADKLDAFLRMMQDKRLMFSESQRFLSLAIPLNRGGEDIK